MKLRNLLLTGALLITSFSFFSCSSPFLKRQTHFPVATVQQNIEWVGDNGYVLGMEEYQNLDIIDGQIFKRGYRRDVFEPKIKRSLGAIWIEEGTGGDPLPGKYYGTIYDYNGNGIFDSGDVLVVPKYNYLRYLDELEPAKPPRTKINSPLIKTNNAH